MDCIDLAGDGARWWDLVNVVMNLDVLQNWAILTTQGPVSFSKMTLLHGIVSYFYFHN
jgi:hypothetical protein